MGGIVEHSFVHYIFISIIVHQIQVTHEFVWRLISSFIDNTIWFLGFRSYDIYGIT